MLEALWKTFLQMNIWKQVIVIFLAVDFCFVMGVLLQFAIFSINGDRAFLETALFLDSVIFFVLGLTETSYALYGTRTGKF